MKYTYFFDEGNKDMADLLGTKGANLAEMTQLGLPVPEGFTISTEACRRYLAGKDIYSLRKEIFQSMGKLGEIVGKKYDDYDDPLLLSIRSGAADSMPGMMSTIINVGVNWDSLDGIIRKTSKTFAYKSFEEFMISYAIAAFGMKQSDFEVPEIKKYKYADRISVLEGIIYNTGGNSVPNWPSSQISESVYAIFRSWNSKAAVEYRRLNNMDDKAGTAATIQRMVFGNLGKSSYTGVISSRNDATGRKGLCGEFLRNAQGPDLVSGLKNPIKISALRKSSPRSYHFLEDTVKKLESHYKAVPNVEFTVEKDKPYIMQTRNEKLSPQAAIKAAIDMVDEGLIRREEALANIKPAYLQPGLIIDHSQRCKAIAKGSPVNHSVAIGRIALTKEKADQYKRSEDPVILVKHTLDSDDISAIEMSEGIITANGGTKCHASVVARGLNKTLITACKNLAIDEEKNIIQFGSKKLAEGSTVTLDGYTGRIIAGEKKLIQSAASDGAKTIARWIDDFVSSKNLRVRLYADCPEDLERISEDPLANNPIVIYRSDTELYTKYIDQLEDLLVSRRVSKAKSEQVVKHLSKHYESLLKQNNTLEFMLSNLSVEDILPYDHLDLELSLLNDSKKHSQEKRKISAKKSRYKKVSKRKWSSLIYGMQLEALNTAAKKKLKVYVPKGAAKKNPSQYPKIILINQSNQLFVPYSNYYGELLNTIQTKYLK